MTDRSAFNDEQWELVSSLPGLVLGGAALADGRKLITTVREMVAGDKALKEGVAQHGDNALLSAIVTDATSGTKDLSSATSGSSVEDAVRAMGDRITQAAAILRLTATPEEFAQIGEVLLNAATAVAERTGSGRFGHGGEHVDAGERDFIDRVASAFA
jgi:hypothetical protein